MFVFSLVSLSRPASPHHSNRQRAVLNAVGSPVFGDVQNAGVGVAYLSEMHVEIRADSVRCVGAQLSGAEFWLRQWRDSADRGTHSRRNVETIVETIVALEK